MRFGVAFTAASLLCLSASANSDGLKPETVQAWDEYIHRVDQGVNLQVKSVPVNNNHPFLRTDEDPARAAKLRRGEIVTSAANRAPLAVPHGLIHDWIGTMFIPDVTVAQVFTVVRDYDRYSTFYRPVVVDSASLCRPGQNGNEEEKFRVRYFHKVLFVTETLEGEYSVHYVQVDRKRWYSITQSTHLEEHARGDAPSSVAASSDETGYVWRCYSVTKYEQRDGGVYVEQENVVLSRAIPNSLQWFVGPAVRRLSREVTASSLRQTRLAVLASIGTVYSAAAE